ncbi:Wzz/FepE/Etk N-terminal domain-containing protein [Pseudoalteromonas rubra]|uniref:LPS O-antigen length regulator n=1 Tax=Pseudoalteromonas rubra TaxID=43658 RepID=A0A0U3GJL8_9GAMM|nr:Wzz/FepE/Etk N-terminal domain-containing protein [Pseudoalteromonas rubra]ALU43243.1 hypothetical protein AT705_09995 [Pseudoalteromonas rubra]
MNNRHLVCSDDDIYDKEINFLQLFKVIWQGKLIILLSTIAFSLLAVVYALSLPNIYRSEALLAPAEHAQSGVGSSLGGQLGGLASLAGVNLGSNQISKVQLAIATLQSRAFVKKFVDKYSLLPDLIAAESWDASTGKVQYDPELYDEQSKEWIREVSFPRTVIPSDQEAYESFSDMLRVNVLPDNGMIVLSIEHVSPLVAERWVSLLIEEINKEIKERDIKDSHEYSEYLAKELEVTKVAEMQVILNNLLEEQAKTVMFASVRNEYVFKVIDPALVPESKVAPKRAVICVVGFLIGLFIGVSITFVMAFNQKEFDN